MHSGPISAPPPAGDVGRRAHTREEDKDAATEVLAKYFKNKIPAEGLVPTKPPDIVDWMEAQVYIPETSQPIILMPHQRSITRLALDDDWNFQTVVYSCPKKSGKTYIVGGWGRYLSENSGHRSEVYCVANDKEQAQTRTYRSIISSIELNPNFNKVRRELPGLWRVIDRHSIHIPTNSVVRALSNDYAGEAGSNPVATVWTEIWGLKSEASKRLWTELVPVPTRKRSMRLVETYAGYEDESEILYKLYESGTKHGRRLTHNDIYWPFDDQPPIWINERARMLVYWDSGEVARRMPWQTPEYYEIQKETPGLTPQEFLRLHENKWISSISEFIPIEWWHRCNEPIPALDTRTPCILGIDAGVSSDCCALVLVSRHWDTGRQGTDVAVRKFRIWYPSRGNKVDFEEVKNQIRDWCKQFNVVQMVYDPYQMHLMAQEITREAITWVYEFGQGTGRLVADKQLYDLIRDKRIAQDGSPEMEEHVRNAAAKKTLEDNDRIRIVKKNESKKIDFTVALSMASHECLRLVLS